MAKVGVKLKGDSARYIIGAFAFVMLSLAVAKAGFFQELPNQIGLIVTLSAILVIFTEVGIVSLLRKRGKGIDAFQAIGVTAGSLELVALLLGFFGVAVPFLAGIETFLIGGIALSFFIETFVR